MIDAKELRIGNWVIDRYTLSGDERFTQVVSLYHWKGNGSINASTDKDYYPIPLTTEILENIGLKHGKTGKKKDDSFVEFWDIKTPFIHKHSFGSFYFSIVRWWQDNKPLEFTFSHHEIRVDCKYVHQLQNLVYALTGKELEITL